MASVGVFNHFDLLDDERPAKAKPAPKAAEPAAKPAAKKEGGDNRRNRGNKRNDKPRRDGDNERRGRGGRGAGRGGGRGRGRGRGPRRDGDGEGRAPRRDYDRRSGTGRNDRQKREGGGQYNWGNEEEVITPEDTQVPVAETPVAGQEETPAAAAPEEEEEEDNTITYEQLLAQKAARAVASDRKQGRQVKNDGQWEEAVEVKFEKHIDGVIRQPDEEDDVEVQQKNRKALSFDEFLSTKAKGRGRGGRGGRGEQRGGRQNARGDRVKLDDDNAFPALGQN